MTKNPINIAIIGAGGIAAKLHLPELENETGRSHVALLTGRNASRLKLLSAGPGAAWSTSFEDAISDPAVDAVIVATPHTHHVSWGIAALEAGKHLMMQKPLCADMGEADAFVAAADAAAQRGQVTLCLPHFPGVIHAMRRAIDDGQLGKVVAANARTSHAGPEVYYREVAQIFGETLDEEDLWFFDEKRAGVGAMYDMGVYAVAHLVALLGPVQRVSAFCATLDKPTTLEDSAALLLHMESGALAVAETGWCDGARTWQLRINGTQGKLEMNGAAPATLSAPKDYQSDRAEIETRTFAPDESVGNLHQHWLDCIASGTQPVLSSARAARHVTQILLAAGTSARTGQIVTLGD